MRHAGPNNLRLLGQVCTNNDDARFNLNNLPCLPGQKNPCGQWLSHPNFGACFVGVQTICCAQPHIPKIDCTQCTQCRHFLQARVAFTRQWQMFQNTPYPSNVYIYISILCIYIYIQYIYSIYIYHSISSLLRPVLIYIHGNLLVISQCHPPIEHPQESPGFFLPIFFAPELVNSPMGLSENG